MNASKTILTLAALAPTCLAPACTSTSTDTVATTEDSTDDSDTTTSGSDTSTDSDTDSEADTDTSDSATVSELRFDSSAWNYDAANDVYYQIGVAYCSTPATEEYETLGIYVPGAYLQATENDDGTFTATLNPEGMVNGYTTATAPVVFPVNTPGYSAQAAPTEYSYESVSSYLEAGFIYIHAGMRGRANGYDDDGNLAYSGGAPWGITDLKAAVRYYRFNGDLLPGASDRLVTFGMSGGGAQSTLMGATGDSDLYTDYLESIGAAMTMSDGTPISDAVNGVMAWCPITSLDYADAAYEWNMGQFSSSDTRVGDSFRSALSADLAGAFATYINGLGLKAEDGTMLQLEASDTGIYTAGSYYEYIVGVVQESLNNFLSDTTFPYTPSSNSGGPGGGGAPGDGGPPSDAFALDGEDVAVDATEEAEVDADGTATTDEAATETSTTYATAADYIAALNAEETWVEYDAETNTATVLSLGGFARQVKTPSKDVPAFDDVERAQGENQLFGTDESDSLHFDETVASLLSENEARYAAFSDWDESLVSDYASDLQQLDALGYGIALRGQMYNPMYYLTSAEIGPGDVTLAPHWRINTGIEQGDTASTVEVNLALALKQQASVEDVSFTTVWGQGHTEAERTGDSTENFIAWVQEVLPQ